MRQPIEPQPPSLGLLIARRILAEQDVAENKIVVSIGLPMPDRLSKHGGWECPFLIEGVGESRVQRAFGVDAMQALILAIQGIRVGLEQTGRKLFWLDPDIGADIPLYFPPSFGKQYEQRLRLAIERETVRAWRATIKSRRAGIRAQEAKLRRQGIAPTKIARMLAQQKTSLNQWEAQIKKLKPGWNRPTPIGERRDGRLKKRGLS
jgi:hypothetical protein